MDVPLLVRAFGAFFAIMNPFVVLPMFLVLTQSQDLAHQRRTGMRIVLYCLVMAAIVMVSGTAILGFFGISVDHFRVAGGIVLLMIGLTMLNGGSPAHEGTPQEKARMRARALHPSGGVHDEPAGRPVAVAVAEPETDADVAFYPLTFPMLLGPGTIASLIVFTGQAGGVPGFLAIVTAVVAVLAILAVVLWFAPAIGNRMSQTLRVIMTRLMGMIIASIAVAMVIEGLLSLLPALRG